MAVTAEPDLTDADEIVATLLYGKPLADRDPYRFYNALRTAAPVHHSERHDMWVLSRYTDITAALRHPGMSQSEDLRSDRRYPSSATLQMFGATMLFQDDIATHSRLRRLVSQAFTRRTVEELRAPTGALVAELMERCFELPTFDFMTELAGQVPVGVICRMLGVPEEDVPTFAEWTYLVTTVTGAVVGDDHVARVDSAATSLRAYLADLLEQRRRRPEDDLLTKLIEVRDGTDQLTEEETLAMAFLLLAAGSDTTAAFLCTAVLGLVLHPAEWQKLRRDRSLLDGAIEELLRFDGPVHYGIMRRTTAALTLPSGVTIPVGARVWTILAAGNRDPDKFDSPDELDISRPNVHHLAFVRGMHVCLGAMLARMESEVVLGEVLDRFSRLELIQDPIPWVDHGNLRELTHLELEGVPA